MTLEHRETAQSVVTLEKEEATGKLSAGVSAENTVFLVAVPSAGACVLPSVQF